MENLLGKKVIPPRMVSIASLNDTAMVFQKGYRVMKEIKSKKLVFKR
jgi:hypothetical protein